MLTQNSTIKAQVDNSNRKSSDLHSRTRSFSLHTIYFLETLPNKRAYWAIGDQLVRSATSIGANIVEAKASSSRREYIKYFEIALKSANETQYWLELLQELLKNEEQATTLHTEAVEISRMLGASIITLKGKRVFNNKNFDL